MTEGHTGTGILWLVSRKGRAGSAAQDLQPFALGVDANNLNTGGRQGSKATGVRVCFLRVVFFYRFF